MGAHVPTIGRIVIYRSRTGRYDVPAMITQTVETVWQPGVDAGGVPPLSSDTHVHLTVFTPGFPGHRTGAADFASEPIARSENVAGCYQEWDIPLDPAGGPGTWRWPPPAPLAVPAAQLRGR